MQTSGMQPSPKSHQQQLTLILTPSMASHSFFLKASWLGRKVPTAHLFVFKNSCHQEGSQHLGQTWEVLSPKSRQRCKGLPISQLVCFSTSNVSTFPKMTNVKVGPIFPSRVLEQPLPVLATLYPLERSLSPGLRLCYLTSNNYLQF